MQNIIFRIAALAFVFLASAAAHAEGQSMESWPNDRAKDRASLQNGARLFANYCVGCHSANLVRWSKLEDIGLDEKQIKEFLVPGNQKVGDLMKVAMAPADAKTWLGKTPPDLSVITRARTSFEYSGPDYLYTLWRTYYRDSTSATGWNNVAYPKIAMPHVLWDRQGPREATIVTVEKHENEKTGHEGWLRSTKVFDAEGNLTATEEELTSPALEGTTYKFKPLDPARASAYDSEVADLVAFLTFITDPSHDSRVKIGVWVLLFLGLFTLIAWRLNAVYWRDIH